MNISIRQIFIVLSTMACLPLIAQINSDMSGIGTSVSFSNPDYTISGGSQRGGNLFHSFQNFNLSKGQLADFQGSSTVHNIISRVTGGNASSINGTIRSSISGANFFFINPAGISFGPDASLDLTGSAYFSTADRFGFSDGSYYSVSDTSNSVLTVASIQSFGFLSDTPSPMQTQGSSLKVPLGESLSFIAGDISLLDGALYASEGVINMISLASGGNAYFADDSFNLDEFSAFGDIQITSNQFVSERPLDIYYPLANLDASGENGGSIYLRSGNLTMDNGWIFADVRGSGSGKNVDIAVTDSIVMDNESRITSDAVFAVQGGTIFLTARQMDLLNGSQIAATNYGDGTAGSIFITLAEDFNIAGISGNESRLFGGNGDPRNAGLSVENYAGGQGGSISIHANNIVIDDSAQITARTYRSGSGGNIEITADSLDVHGGAAIAASTEGAGNAGRINLNIGNVLDIAGRSSGDVPEIFANQVSRIESSVFSSGDGGVIAIRAGKLVSLSDGGQLEVSLKNNPVYGQPEPDLNTRAGSLSVEAEKITILSGARAGSINSTGGIGGSIYIAADSLIIQGQSGQVSTTSGLFSNALSSGNSGNIKLDIGNLQIVDATMNTSTVGEGNAGEIDIHADQINLLDGGRISASTASTGNASNINLAVDKTLAISGFGEDNFSSGIYSKVQVDSGNDPLSITGQGGNITISSADLNLQQKGTVSAATDGAGGAGKIQINLTDSLIAESNSIISTSTSSTGNAGIINLTADSITIKDNASIVSNTSKQGSGGKITIDANNLQLSGGGKITSNTSSSGNAGSLQLTIKNSATISGNASGLFTTVESDSANSLNILSGRGGDIHLVAAELSLQSGIISAETKGVGDAGTVNIDLSDRLEMNDGSLISTSTTAAGNAGLIDIHAQSVGLSGASSISSGTAGSGFGGSITLSAIGEIYLSDRKTGIFSNVSEKEGSGRGGNIFIFSNNLNMKNRSEISAKSIGTGDAGNIQIESSDTISLAGGSAITTESSFSGGGKIGLKAKDTLYLDRASITSSVANGFGNGGDISIDPIYVILNKSQIIAQAFAGNGGNITIDTQYYIASLDSVVDASSKLGISGVVSLNNADTDNISLDVLQSEFYDSSVFLRQRCAAKQAQSQDRGASSFVVGGLQKYISEPDRPLLIKVEDLVGSNYAAAINPQVDFNFYDDATFCSSYHAGG